jgi:hypothetical protein
MMTNIPKLISNMEKLIKNKAFVVFPQLYVEEHICFFTEDMKPVYFLDDGRDADMLVPAAGHAFFVDMEDAAKYMQNKREELGKRKEMVVKEVKELYDIGWLDEDDLRFTKDDKHSGFFKNPAYMEIRNLIRKLADGFIVTDSGLFRREFITGIIEKYNPKYTITFHLKDGKQKDVSGQSAEFYRMAFHLK